MSNRHYSLPPMWLSWCRGKEIRQGIQVAHFNPNSVISPVQLENFRTLSCSQRTFVTGNRNREWSLLHAGEGTLVSQEGGEVGLLE